MSAARAGGYLQSASWSAPISDLEVARRIAFLLELGRRTPTAERTSLGRPTGSDARRATPVHHAHGRQARQRSDFHACRRRSVGQVASVAADVRGMRAREDQAGPVVPRPTPYPQTEICLSRSALVEIVRAELIDYCYGRRELGPARLEEDARYLGFAICDRALLIQGESDALL